MIDKKTEIDKLLDTEEFKKNRDLVNEEYWNFKKTLPPELLLKYSDLMSGLWNKKLYKYHSIVGTIIDMAIAYEPKNKEAYRKALESWYQVIKQVEEMEAKK